MVTESDLEKGCQRLSPASSQAYELGPYSNYVKYEGETQEWHLLFECEKAAFGIGQQVIWTAKDVGFCRQTVPPGISVIVFKGQSRKD